MGNGQLDVGVATGGCGIKPWWVLVVLRNRPLRRAEKVNW